MKQPTERDFALRRLLPLFRRLGFQYVRWTHGMDEYGRDLVFYDIDRFGIQKLYGAQVKLGDISGAAGIQIEKIISQIDDALKMPYMDIRLGEKKYITGLYVIISGKFTRNAKEKFLEKCRGKPVFLLEGEDIDNLESGAGRHGSDAAKMELGRLRREALAASRSRPEDMRLFDQKLHEIDLFEQCSTLEKIEALAELSLEVPLNSDTGTRLLVEHLLWQIAGWETRPLVKTICGLGFGRRLLEALASTLWEIGVEIVEYNRKNEMVQIVVDAILQVAEKARLIEATQALESCKAALNSILHQAHAKNRSDVLNLIQAASNEVH